MDEPSTQSKAASTSGRGRALLVKGVGFVDRWTARAEATLDRGGRRALSLCTQLSTRTAADAGPVLRNLRRYGRYLYRRRHAIRVGQESVAACRQLGDRRREALELNALGRAYRARGDYGDAVVCYTQALGIFQHLGNRRGECLSLSNLGLAHEAQGNGPKAARCYESALDIARLLDDQQIEGQILANLATTYKRQGRGREARDLWEEALNLLTPGSAPHRELSAHLGLGA